MLVIISSTFQKELLLICFMKTVKVICAIIINSDRVLMAQRSEKMSLPLKWEFPGGKLKPHETEEECIHRELFEELAISVKIIKRLKDVFHNYGDIKIHLIPFLVNYEKGTIILSEHKEARWVMKHELPDLDLAAADVPILEEFLTFY